MTIRIIFSNTTGDMLIQAGNQEYKFKATSGKGDCMNNQNCEAIPYKGPTPKGAYYIVAKELDDPNYAVDVARWLGISNVQHGKLPKLADWGDFRMPLRPQLGTYTNNRDNKFHQAIKSLEAEIDEDELALQETLE
jgi:hypothetical protein